MPCEPAAARSDPAVSRLDRNLSALVDPELARRVRGCGSRLAHLALRPDGRRVLRLGGHDLTDAGPEREAEACVAASPSLDDCEHVVLIGLGLGHLLHAIRRRTAAPIVVLEPSLEVLRVVLATQPLALEAVRIVDTPAALRDHLAAQLTLRERVSIVALPAYERLFPALGEAARAATRRAAELAAVTGNTLELRAAVWAEHLTENLARIPGRTPATALAGWLAGRPAILCAAGPSLDKNVGELRRVESRAAIVAVNTSLAALERAGVRADLVVALEAVDVTSQLAGLELNARCARLLDVTAHPALFASAPAEVIPFASQIPFFQPLTAAAGLGPGLPIGGSAANAALALCHLAGASPIILCGQDLAYSEDRVYAEGTCFGTMRARRSGEVIELTGLEAKRRLAAPRPEVDTTVERKGVLLAEAYGGGGEVLTSVDFNYFRHHFERFAERAGCALVNATEGGARIRGFREQPLARAVDALAPGRIPPLPAAPCLERGRIEAALGAERAAAEQAARVARGDPADLHALRAAVAGSTLLQAYAHRAVQEVARGRRDAEAFLRELERSAARVIDETGRALGRLARFPLKFSRELPL
jgi:hypothetical protein